MMDGFIGILVLVLVIIGTVGKAAKKNAPPPQQGGAPPSAPEQGWKKALGGDLSGVPRSLQDLLEHLPAQEAPLAPEPPAPAPSAPRERPQRPAAASMFSQGAGARPRVPRLNVLSALDEIPVEQAASRFTREDVRKMVIAQEILNPRNNVLSRR